MNIVLIQNRSSGVGNRHGLASDLAEHLISAGHSVRTLEAGAALARETVDAALADASLCIIAGGDGTVHYNLNALSASRVPVYHFPIGTENLFARHFGMDRDIDRLLDAIRAAEVATVDLAECSGRMFSLMCSVGFDAAVVERVAANRSGGVRRADYVKQALCELAEPRTPRLSISIDGRAIVENRKGLVVIANSRQYAARLDPARNASMTDGLLDVVFMPHTTRVGLAKWLLAIRGGVHLRSSQIVCAQGKSIAVTIEGASPHQLDGEAAPIGKLIDDRRTLDVCVLPSALRVLTPRPR